MALGAIWLYNTKQSKQGACDIVHVDPSMEILKDGLDKALSNLI